MAQPPPPLLTLGQSGQLSGQTYTVAGRMEMAVDDEGETYSWNEFHLVAPDGAAATLVQEQGERGVEWRLFRLITPTTPMSAGEASTKRVGNVVDLTGERLRVTLVGTSRVVRIEGRVPEGIEEGDVASYFNAESGNQMLVVSWTGQEVDVYRGIQLPTHAVYRAFGLQPPPMPIRAAPAPSPASLGARKVLITIVLALLGVGVVNGRRFGCDRASSLRTNPALQPPLPRLSIGSVGIHDGTRYRVLAREQVEFSRVGAKDSRQEYQLTDDAGATVLLQQLSESAGGRWHWLIPVELDSPLRPTQAATNHLGDAITVGHEALRVADFFMAVVQAKEGTNGAATGGRRYGLEARGATQRVELRWDETNLSAYRVAPATKDELASFGIR